MTNRTKEDLIKTAAGEAGVTQKIAKEVIDAAFAAISGLQAGDSFSVQSFGRFSAEMTKVRTVRNPATGETMQTTPRRRLTFKGSKPSK